MKENIKIALSIVTLVIVVSGFLLTIDQVRSTNEIRLENNRTNIIASSDPEVLFNIANRNTNMGANEMKFLRAMFSHYVNVYRIKENSRQVYGAISESYVADASRSFCWWLSLPMAKAFWNMAKVASADKQQKGGLQGSTDLSRIEREWCTSAAQ